jgi:hypothetical protein
MLVCISYSYCSGIVTSYRLDSTSLGSGKIFLLSTMSRPVLGPTQLPIQWALEALSLGLKWLGREAVHSPSASVEVKNGGSIHQPPCVFTV